MLDPMEEGFVGPTLPPAPNAEEQHDDSITAERQPMESAGGETKVTGSPGQPREVRAWIVCSWSLCF